MFIRIHVGAEEDRVLAASNRLVSAAAAVKAPSMTNVMSDIGASAQSDEQQVCVCLCVGVIRLNNADIPISLRILFENVCCGTKHVINICRI